MDHGLFNEYSLLSGIEDIRRGIELVVNAAPDAVQLSPGHAHLLHGLQERQGPALILRVDVTNVYGSVPGVTLYDLLIENAVEKAIQLDAAGIVTNLFYVPDHPRLHEQCIASICKLQSDCERFGLPLMVEPLVLRLDAESNRYLQDGSVERISSIVRQAVELGADIIKADVTDRLEDYHRVIEIASGIPVLVRGGGRVTDEVLLQRTYEVMQQGAAGIVYGRNIYQHPIPDKITRALMSIVHEGQKPEIVIGQVRI